jgi:hypothetical protein
MLELHRVMLPITKSIQGGGVCSTKGNGVTKSPCCHPISNVLLRFWYAPQGLHQSKTISWVTKSHSCHNCYTIRSQCQMHTKGRCESHSLTTSTWSWSPWCSIHYGFSPCRRRFPHPPHQHVVAPHHDWRVAASKATMPSLEGHEDLKRSESLKYKGNTALSLKALRL